MSKDRPDVFFIHKVNGNRYKVVDVKKSDDYIRLLNEVTGVEFDTKISHLSSDTYRVEKDESWTPPPPVKSRKAGRVVSERMKAEAKPWLERMEAMLPELAEVAKSDSVKLERVIKYMKTWMGVKDNEDERP